MRKFLATLMSIVILISAFVPVMAAEYDVATLGNHEFDYDMAGCLNVIDLADFPYVSANLNHEENGVCGENVLDSFVIFDCGEEKLANYVQGFENGVVGASNSPLNAKSPAFMIDYSTVADSERIEIGEGSGEPAFDDEVWVGGIQVTDENKDDILGDGGSVKYDPRADLLTLTDATVTNNAGHGIYAYGINLTINGIDTEAEGSNTITGKCVVESGVDEEGYEHSSTESGCGIFLEGDGFGGNGGITINGILGNITGDEGSGISAYEDIIISGTVGDINCTGGIAGGISSDFGSVIIEKTGSVGNITSEYNGICAPKSVIIAGKAGNINGGGYAGVHVTGGEAIISGNVESIAGFAGGIEVYKGFDWDKDGNEVYTGGNVTINGKIGKILGGVVGIRTDADLNISGSAEVTATDAETDDKLAISVGGNVVMSDENNISDPAEYQIKSVLIETYEDQNGPVEVWHNTVCESEGNIALTVKFKGFVNPFEDVNTSDWYYADVEYVVVNGLMSGLTETTFAPNDKLTRAMLVTVLYRVEGEPATNKSIPFSDVDMSSYYANAVSWAKQNGIVSGMTENEFAPNDNITREQIAAIMYCYAQYKEYDTTQGGMLVREFSDYEEISDYALNAMTWAVNSDLLNGKGNNALEPKANATRAEIAAILQRFIEANK